MKIPNLFLLLSLISFLSIILVTGSTLKSYTNFYENNNHILLKLLTIYAQDNSGDFEDGDIFPDFKTEDKGGKGKDGGGDGGKGKDGGGDGGKEKDGDEQKEGGGDGGKEKDGGNEGRINENTNDFSPLSSGSPTNTDDKVNPYVKVNPYGSPTNTDDKVNPYDEVGQPVGQQSEQEAEDSVQVDQQRGEQLHQRTVGNGVNQTEQQTVGNEVNQTGNEVNQTGNEVNQTEQHTVGNGVNLTEQQQDTGQQAEQQTVGNEVNLTEQQQDTRQQAEQQSDQQP